MTPTWEGENIEKLCTLRIMTLFKARIDHLSQFTTVVLVGSNWNRSASNLEEVSVYVYPSLPW